MESQTLCPHLKIQLSSNETQTERNKECWNKSAGGRGGKRMGEVWGDTAGGDGQKNSMILLPCLKKESAWWAKRCVRPSGALVPSFHVQRRLPSDFQWEKWTQWCIALILFNEKKKERERRTGSRELPWVRWKCVGSGVVSAGGALQSQQFVLNGVRMETLHPANFFLQCLYTFWTLVHYFLPGLLDAIQASTTKTEQSHLVVLHG